MGKKSRNRNRAAAATGESRQEGATAPRQPCPCGSGRRYKNCHGSAAGAPPVFTSRPFEGLSFEADLVALREFVPAATAPLRLTGSERSVLLCSLLPGAAPALVRADGAIWLGLQVQHSYGDPSRDLAAVLIAALDAPNGEMVGLSTPPGEGQRFQDLVVDAPLDVTVHEGFDYWVADAEDDGSMAALLDAANEAAAPTAKVAGVEAAYLTSAGAHDYLRWVLPHDEDRVLDAFARMHAAGTDHLVEGGRLIGMFRAHGLAVPVWDVPLGTGADALAEPLADLAATLETALGSTEPLTTDERAARAGLANRQLTIR